MRKTLILFMFAGCLTACQSSYSVGDDPLQPGSSGYVSVDGADLESQELDHQRLEGSGF